MSGIPSIAAGQDGCKNGNSIDSRFAITFTNSGTLILSQTSGWALGSAFRVGNTTGAFPATDGAPRVCTGTTPGAMVVQPPKSGQSLFVVEIDVTLLSGSIGTLYLFDRYADIVATEGSAPFASGALDATSQLAAGDYCQIMTETGPSGTGTPSGTPWTITYNYTNESNVAHSAIARSRSRRRTSTPCFRLI